MCDPLILFELSINIIDYYVWTAQKFEKWLNHAQNYQIWIISDSMH